MGPEKENFKCHKMDQNEILPIKFYPRFHNPDEIIYSKFTFLGSHKKLSLVLLQITNYIYSP